MEKILVVEDDKISRRIIREILSRSGYEVFEAEDGAQGLESFKANKPDLVLTDYQMPVMNGLRVLSEIRNLQPAVPVIMLTGFGDIALIIKSIQLGAFDFLEKPINTPQLKEVVASALNSVISSKKHDQVLTEGISIDKKIQENILIGRSPQIKDIFKNIGRVSLNKVNILIEGESGTGKELIARLIHYSGITRDKPLVVVNCSALTETLLESELFGHEKGSFTGSLKTKKGKFELAEDGTIFLDEISEISPNTQVKLLRVIQELEFERVGGETTLPMQARIIAATNKKLEKLIEEGKFREDLYYRLKVFTVQLPPLRERREDIKDLTIHFLTKLNKRFNKNVTKIGDGVIEMLQQHTWPGNVRELENTIMQAIVMSKNDVLEVENIKINQRATEGSQEFNQKFELRSLADIEKDYIKRVLDEVRWNKIEASRILEITRPTLNAKIEKYKLEQE
ncbi:Regulatory protein AtoC [bioreactor metagenome]|jgi:two-component system response regulator AtoC|uniref:Regulatory protein AtoC n=1 Tax=bioreactor metagenome TaxID=1076179 RepID=A0A644WAU9_9ZZZZ|nr:sigma-54-dependent Fis family transcriptional regulator [Bacteroidales bacterium]WRQ32750.1 sigma-54 dependent transcriptional regulator [Bacteroidales bacterium MB20-C3-3]